MIFIAVFIIIFLLLLLLSMVWPPDSPWSPWWRTNKEIARAACKLAKISSKDKVYELGSGDGSFLIVASKEFGARTTGIEIDPLRFYISKARVLFSGLNISIYRKNFFRISLKDATVIYAYLVPKALNRLIPKLKKEVKPGTTLVSYKYQMKLPLIKKDIKNSLFLYKI